MKNKPNVLYRGIKINYNSLQNFDFTGVDLKVNYDPIIDQYGRKIVADGNEYGVYMTDNLNMVTSAYGNLHHDGTPINNQLSISGERIMIPSVAVIYQINTDGLDIRKPFISDQLMGVYNNGFQGDEWIADIVPASNYKLYRVKIGSDILHDAEDIDLLKVDDISEEVLEKLEMRRYRLETLANAIEKMPPVKRNLIGSDELDILKSIYGENGLKYINEDSLSTTNADDMLKYLATKIFKQSESDVDFQTIKYINSLNGRATNIDSIIEILKADKMKNMQEKVAFEKRKKEEGTSYSTSRFDRQEKRLNSLMSMIFIRKNKDSQSNQKAGPVSDTVNETDEDKEWEMIKEKYFYDDLEPERQQIIEQQFHKMIYKRKLNKAIVDDAAKDRENAENIEHSRKRMM